MNIDLNESNYDYNKLLELFSLEDNFDINDLKECRKKVLKLHPDKSHLDKKYFLFFYKMYKKLLNIYEYVHHEKDIEKYKEYIDPPDHFKNYLERNNIDPRKDFKRFSKEFNKMFEHVYVKENEEGYKDWLSSGDNMYDKDDIEKSRKKAIQENALIEKNNDYIELESSNSLFNKLGCYDVKESHGNPIFAMDVNEEFKKKKKFKSVQEYQMYLQKQDEQNTPTSLEQSNNLIKQREQMLNNQAKTLAYNNMVRKEKTDEKYQNYITNYLRLQN